MRAAPPLVVDIPRQAAWQGGIFLLVLLASLLLFTWVGMPDPEAAPAVRWGVAAVAAACVLAALGLLRVTGAPCRLWWDGATWFAADGVGPGAVGVPGRLRVMLDLSVAVLLRFDADGVASPSVRWIPVSSVRLPPAQWQALRRTVYSAPLHVGGSPGGDGPRTE